MNIKLLITLTAFVSAINIRAMENKRSYYFKAPATICNHSDEIAYIVVKGLDQESIEPGRDLETVPTRSGVTPLTTANVSTIITSKGAYVFMSMGAPELTGIHFGWKPRNLDDINPISAESTRSGVYYIINPDHSVSIAPKKAAE